jgi:spore coat polysaccharide biosynthesis protein SpsF
MPRSLIGIQARSKSTRFPGKIYAEFDGKSVLQHVYEACKKAADNSRKIDEAEAWVLAPKDDKQLIEYCLEHDVKCKAPDCDESELVKRYVLGSEGFDRVIRITADCPLMQPSLIIDCMKVLDDMDYVSNTMFRTYPDGYDLQGCKREFLLWVDENQKEGREHPFWDYDFNLKIRGSANWKSANLLNPQNIALLKISLDTEKDLEVIKRVYEEMHKRVGGEVKTGLSTVAYGNQQ